MKRARRTAVARGKVAEFTWRDASGFFLGFVASGFVASASIFVSAPLQFRLALLRVPRLGFVG
ncbi:MAG: hypothetical protein AAF500_04315 [Myxococcota bacterium]